MSNICFLLSCLLIPLSFGLIDLQSTLPLNGTVHTLFEIMIILAIFWLIWLLNRFDRWLYLRSFSSPKKSPLSQKRKVETSIFTMETSTTPDSTGQKKKTEQIAKPVLDPSSRFDVPETRVTIKKLIQ